MTNLDNVLKSRDITLPTKVCIVKAIIFPVVMCGCESWTKKKADCWGNSGFELPCLMAKALEIALDCKEIKPIHPKGNYSWIFIGRTDPEAETPILWSPNVKNWLTGKDPDAGKDWRWEESRMTEDVPWWLDRTWVWVSSGSWWWTGKPGMLLSMGLQRVGHDWASELNWTYVPG